MVELREEVCDALLTHRVHRVGVGDVDGDLLRVRGRDHAAPGTTPELRERQSLSAEGAVAEMRMRAQSSESKGSELRLWWPGRGSRGGANENGGEDGRERSAHLRQTVPR